MGFGAKNFLCDLAYNKEKTFGAYIMADMFGNICTCRRCNGIVHTIKRGDTLYQLSRYYNVTINEIMRANANVNVYNLQVGEQICIPVRNPMPMPGPGPVRPPMPGQGRPPMSGPGPVRPPMPGRPPMSGVVDPQVPDLDNPDIPEPVPRPMPGRPSLIQPRSEEIERNGESNQEYISTSANSMYDDDDMKSRYSQEDSDKMYGEDDMSSACCGSSMKVKDLLKSDDMTLEELANMLKNL